MLALTLILCNILVVVLLEIAFALTVASVYTQMFPGVYDFEHRSADLEHNQMVVKLLSKVYPHPVIVSLRYRRDKHPRTYIDCIHLGCADTVIILGIVSYFCEGLLQ